MSILIKGMEMPRNDEMLFLKIYPDGKVAIDGDLECKQIATAVSIPPHGRLIDADMLLMRINHEVMEAYMDGVCYGVHPSQEHLHLLGEIIDDAPTVIEAEG